MGGETRNFHTGHINHNKYKSLDKCEYTDEQRDLCNLGYPSGWVTLCHHIDLYRLSIQLGKQLFKTAKNSSQEEVFKSGLFTF